MWWLKQFNDIFLTLLGTFFFEVIKVLLNFSFGFEVIGVVEVFIDEALIFDAEIHLLSDDEGLLLKFGVGEVLETFEFLFGLFGFIWNDLKDEFEDFDWYFVVNFRILRR